MRRNLVLWISTSLTALAAVAAGLYAAWLHVPAFYRQALVVNQAQQKTARDEFVSLATGLASDVHRGAAWQGLFTTGQINAWLALAGDESGLLPPEVRDPRVALCDHLARIACQYDHDGRTTILSLDIDAFLQEPGVVALRIRRARAGALPLPLGQLLEGIAETARRLQVRIEWRQAHGDPVALVFMNNLVSSRRGPIELESLELREGEIYIAGHAASHDAAESARASKDTFHD